MIATRGGRHKGGDRHQEAFLFSERRQGCRITLCSAIVFRTNLGKQFLASAAEIRLNDDKSRAQYPVLKCTQCPVLKCVSEIWVSSVLPLVSSVEAACLLSTLQLRGVFIGCYCVLATLQQKRNNLLTFDNSVCTRG